MFQYVNDEGEIQDVTSQDVNDYLREITGEDFTAKDFRTWAGTVLAAMALNAQEEFETKKQARSNVRTAIAAVAEILGNTVAICRKCYVHPAVLEAYLDRTSLDGLKGRAENDQENVDLRSSEAAVLKFLRGRLKNRA